MLCVVESPFFVIFSAHARETWMSLCGSLKCNALTHVVFIHRGVQSICLAAPVLVVKCAAMFRSIAVLLFAVVASLEPLVLQMDDIAHMMTHDGR